MRLFAIIKSTFANHARTATLINAFSEGISLASSSVDMNPSVQTSNGFELIRQLTLEYSIRTRNEALTFRTALANKTFALSTVSHAGTSSQHTLFFFGAPLIFCTPNHCGQPKHFDSALPRSRNKFRHGCQS